MSDDLKALRTTVLLLQDWLDDGFLGWLHDDSECVELIREAPKNLASLEAQNQALQERNAELERRAAVRVGHMLDDDHAALSNQVVALQERAERAELAWTAANDRLATLTRVDHLDPSNNGTIPVLREALQRIASMSPSTDNAGWLAAVTIARNALSPAQETDPG